MGRFYMAEVKSVTKYVADWLVRAAEDIQVAKILIKEEGLPNSVCFHSQQAGEKYLKAFLAFQGKNVRKVHDLNALLTLCGEIDKSFSELKPEVDYLNKFYIETRYPADIPSFTTNEAEKAVETALRIKEFVLSKIK